MENLTVEQLEDTQTQYLEIAPEVRDALIAYKNLSQDDVAQIAALMQEQHLNFLQASFQLKFLTEDDLHHVAPQEQRPRRSGIIQNALRRVSGRQELVVRQGEAKPSDELLRSQRTDNERNEKLRALRTQLMLLNDSGVIALVSPERGEGRSRLCADLAMMFAQLGRRTLLIDADLRHPSQHTLFCADNQWGLAEALSNDEAPYLYGVRELPELSLITAGKLPLNPLELVSNSRFERLVTRMRRQYDFILIDTPAMTPYSDGMQIAAVAKRVLVLSRASATDLAKMNQMLTRLAVTDSKILGAVINRY
jgi:receptor protein-tyrosine kinase